jgi:hypothetical protein
MVWPFKKRGYVAEMPINEQLFPDFNEVARHIEQAKGKAKVSPSQEHSFFEELLKNIEKQTSNIESSLKLYDQGFLKQNMLENMKRYWDEKKVNYMFNFSEQDLRHRLVQKVESLKNLEREWQGIHLQLSEKEEQIRQEEKEMKITLKELKEFCSHHLQNNKSIKKFHDVPHEHSLILSDGTVIKSLHDLQLALMSMPENTFKKHVNNRKNDFSNWVRNAFSDHKLAANLEKSKRRSDMIHLLK